MNKMVSLIIPCYNLENEIGACLESVFEQTYNNIEIIIINDGSTDRTLEICEQYAKKDSRVLLLTQENQGVSACRNKGLDLSTGEFICFVDGDDLVSADYVELLLRNILKYDCDISSASYTKQRKQLGRVTQAKPTVWNSKQALTDYLEKGSFFPGPVCKLFKKALIKDIRFDEKLRISEDKLFVFQALEKCRNIVFQDAYIYYYYQRSTSAMHSNFDERFLDSKYVTDCLSNRWKKLYPELENMIEAEKMLSYSRRIQDSTSDDSNLSRELRIVFRKELKQCSVRKLAPYLKKKELFLLLLAKYSIPCLKLYEFLKQ